jgi:hypothetical protein
MWYSERMLQDDTPFYIIKLVQQQRLICEHNRFSAFLIQWIPFCFLKLNAGLETITRSYSIAFSIYYVVIFLLGIYVLKNEAGAVLFLLFICMTSARDFFLPVGEYQPAIITSTVLFGINLSPDSPKMKLRFFTAISLLIIISNFHLTGVLSALIILSWNLFNAEKRSKKYWVYLLLSLVIISLVRSWILPHDDYESEKLNSLKELPYYLFHPGQLKILTAAMHFFQFHFLPLLFLCAVSITVLALQKKFLSIIVLTGVEYLLFVLTGVIHGINSEYILYGGYFLNLLIPVLIPIVNYILSRKQLFALPSALIISIITFIYFLFQEQTYFRKKTEYFRAIIQAGRTFPERRYIIEKKNLPEFIENSWPITFQTLLLSSIPHQDSSVTYITGETVESYNTFLLDSGSFLGPEWAPDMFNYAANKLPPRYFNLPNKGYRKLTGIESLN